MKPGSVLILVSTMLLSACSDLIEVDLSHERVYIVAPANNTVSSAYSQQFIWEEVDGAESYQIQFVKPSFDAIQQYILDTTTTAFKVTTTLSPGFYQWRVRALNGSSETPFSICNLTIDSTLDLSGQLPVLISPADNYFTTSMSQTFTWQTMPNANNYIFQVLSGGSIIHTQSTTLLNSSYSFAAEGNYQWRVFAQNATSGSGYSTRDVTIDQTSPSVPVILLPAQGDTVSNPVLLTWNSDVGVVGDSIYVYADTNLTILTNDDYSTTESYLFNGSAGQDYFWRVRSRDAAGNWGAYTVRKKFVVAP